ncbi:hypothetical protein OPV22_020257 [Ensete ventricosum]|uniref:Secreted protein n=1 Tax=Ensete ventricosum TaxID=4639 RepID=A0AAV8QMM3_ENSVE|nr:hypothetical protein OPV22_020257 [Ensete ventricosum]
MSCRILLQIVASIGSPLKVDVVISSVTRARLEEGDELEHQAATFRSTTLIANDLWLIWKHMRSDFIINTLVASNSSSSPQQHRRRHSCC